MCPRIKENGVVCRDAIHRVSAISVSAISRHNRIKIIHRFQQLGAVGLLVIVLIKQFGKQYLEIMPVKCTQAVGLWAARKIHQHHQRTVGLLPHQAVNGL